jgi:hypothetical protein
MGDLVVELNQTAPVVETVGVWEIPQQQLLARVIMADQRILQVVAVVAEAQVSRAGISLDRRAVSAE